MDHHLVADIDFSDVTSESPELSEYISEIVREMIETNQAYPSPRPTLDLNWSSRVLFENLPVVPDGKKDQFITVLAKLISKVVPIHVNDIFMPMEGGSSLGFAFVTFPDDESAKSVIDKYNGFYFSKKTMSVLLFTEFDRVLETPETYVEKRVFTQAELKSWLADSQFRDQFAVRYKDKLDVYWNDPISRIPEPVNESSEDSIKTSRYFKWSSQGTYLSTFHAEGVIVWGGPSFDEICRLVHHAVQQLEFSPCERYALTYSSGKNSKFCVWNFQNNELLRTFPGNELAWGAYRWSFDGNYIASYGTDCLFVYRSENMNMLEDAEGVKAPIPVPNISEFAWSPGDNIISIFVSETGAKPAQILMLSIPRRERLLAKALFDVLGCSLFWQSRGEYLATLVTNKQRNSTKPKNSVLETFYVSRRQISTDTNVFNYIIQTLAWEPNGYRFGYLVETGNISRSIIICEVGGQGLRQIGSIDTKFNNFIWSPQSSCLAVYAYALKSGLKGHIELYSVDENTVYGVKELDLSSLNYIEWDPTGRFLLSAHVVDLGIKKSSSCMITTFLGQPVIDMKLDDCYQVAWRPRPKHVIDKNVEQAITKSLESKTKEYEEHDRKLHNEANASKKARNKQLKQAFMARVLAQREVIEHTAQERAELFGYTDQQEASRWISKLEYVDEILKVTHQEI